MARFIGIRHRTKKSAHGAGNPTQVCIVDDDVSRTLELEDEQAELDFVHTMFPIDWCEAGPQEDLSVFPAHHRKERKKDDEVKPTLVPSAYEGLRSGDTVVMVLGGSGDRLAFALSRRASEVGARIARITPKALHDARGEGDKADDAKLLASIAQFPGDPLWDVSVDERHVILLRQLLDARTDAMAARIACEQRLRQRYIGRIFCSEEGGYPEGALEDRFAEAKANDVILVALEQEETRAYKELEKFVKNLEIYRRLFEPVKGCGPMIAARIIADVGDIRRFATPEGFKRYFGLHVRDDHSFPRSKRGEGYSGSKQRLAFYLLGQSFVKTPKGEWGKTYRELRAKYESEEAAKAAAEGRKPSKKAVHSKAFWRTVSRFAKKLWRDWYRYETARRGSRKAQPDLFGTGPVMHGDAAPKGPIDGARHILELPASTQIVGRVLPAGALAKMYTTKPVPWRHESAVVQSDGVMTIIPAQGLNVPGSKDE